MCRNSVCHLVDIVSEIVKVVLMSFLDRYLVATVSKLASLHLPQNSSGDIVMLGPWRLITFHIFLSSMQFDSSSTVMSVSLISLSM